MENTLGFKKVGNIYGGWVKPYRLITVPFSNKNQSPALLSVENYKIVLISGNTLGSLFWKMVLYIIVLISGNTLGSLFWKMVLYISVM